MAGFDERAVTYLLQSIQAEYLEMPGLCLTRDQARRLWGLDQDVCEALLDTLVAARFLRLTLKQSYVLDGPTA